ncbi:MAG: cardiolipin synthase [Treponema sp.]|jgi:cardiolipin synthase|nr:cardiolipin synthase [Treponema sp.]
MAPVRAELKISMQNNWIRVVFRRRVYVIAIILMQIGLILLVIAGSGKIFRYVNSVLHALSVIVCLSILNNKEKPAYKLTWIFLILLFPFFGGFLYLVFCSQWNSRKLRKRIELVRRRCDPLYFLCGDILPDMIENHKEYLTQVRYLQQCAGYPVYKRTQTEYFDSGEGFFKKVMEELEKAERYIFMEFFILREGLMLDPIIGLLKKKAQAGLDVRLIYDDLGCFMSLPPHFQKELKAYKIKCMVFNPFKPMLSSLQNNRDHRKIIVIDGKTAFTGGVNLADEYINAFERFGHWKDAAIMLSGEGAWAFTLIFLHMWNLQPREQDDYRAFYPWKDSPCDIPSEGYVQPYADNPMEFENVGEHVYIQIINNAKEYVYINTPYLVVDDNMVSALTLAAKSGVDVRIITPYRWDKKIVAVASRSYYRQLVSAGVKVYEYSSGFNHSKTFVSDDTVGTVGTINMDFRSLYLHFECGVCIYENPAVASIKQDFLATLPRCHQITLQDCARNTFQQILQDVLRLFAPLM